MSHGPLTLADYLPPSRVTWLDSADKDAALSRLLALVSTSQAVKDPVALQRAMFGREVIMSTGVGYGVAVPHAKLPTVDSFVLALGISDEGIPYRSLVDDQPVRLILMIAGPERLQEGYLKLLSTSMKFIKSEKGKILSSRSPDEISRFAARYPLEPVTGAPVAS